MSGSGMSKIPYFFLGYPPANLSRELSKIGAQMAILAHDPLIVPFQEDIIPPSQQALDLRHTSIEIEELDFECGQRVGDEIRRDDVLIFLPNLLA